MRPEVRRSVRFASRKSLRLRGKVGGSEMVDDSVDPESCTPPTLQTSLSLPMAWEVVAFRILNAVMVLFFLVAVSLLREDDNSCLWIPTFLVPAFLSTIVAVKPQLSECTWWKGWIVIHTALSSLLALVWTIQLIRTYHAERESISLQEPGEESNLSFNPLNYEEGRETLGVLIIIAWMKTTSYVTKTQFRSTAMLPAPRRLVTTALYMAIIPLLLTAVCLLKCTTSTNSCLAVIGL